MTTAGTLLTTYHKWLSYCKIIYHETFL